MDLKSGETRSFTIEEDEVRWAVFVPRMETMTNLLFKSEGKSFFGDKGIDGRIIPEWMWIGWTGHQWRAVVTGVSFTFSVACRLPVAHNRPVHLFGQPLLQNFPDIRYFRTDSLIHYLFSDK